MSHSMEVSLAVGGVMLAASGVSYRRFVRDSLLEPPPAAMFLGEERLTA